jgi:glycosyltransferase involved in cell wall biosynthesis
MTRPHDLVSVVVPTRNRAELLRRALATVRAQTYDHIEVIVIDDASTDDTPAVLDRIAEKDERLRILRTDQRCGGAAARNLGIRAARGAFVAFLDDDDEWLATKLEQQLAVAGRVPEAGVIYCGVAIVDDHGQRRFGPLAAPPDARAALLRENFVATSSALVRTGLLQSVGGFDERMPRLQDWDLWIRLSRVTRFVLLPRYLVRYHLTPDSTTRDGRALAAASALLLQRLQAELSERELGDLCYTLAHVHLAAGQLQRGRALLRRSLRLRPWSARRLIMLAAAHVGTTTYGLICAAHRATQQWQARRVSVDEAGSAA